MKPSVSWAEASYPRPQSVSDVDHDRSINRRTGLRWTGALGAGLLLSGHGMAATPAPVDETWTDSARQRDLPIRIRWPDPAAPTGPRPVVLFSHGLGGTREGGAVWGEAWAEAGFVVVHLQHPGSDLNAVRGVASSFTDRGGLRQAATPAQLIARLRDVEFVLDEIGRRHQARSGRWADARPSQVGLSGHSFGAHTTLGMAGQRYPGVAATDESRLASFIAFSPSLPQVGDPVQAFSGFKRPMLSITGTRDSDVLGNGATPERRMQVFPALPPGGKAHLVLQDADHMTFGGQTGRAAEIVPREAVTRDLQAAHHALVASITTDWWRWTLSADPQARDRLARPAGLRPADRWEQK